MSTECKRRSVLAALFGGTFGGSLLSSGSVTSRATGSTAGTEGWPSRGYDGGNTGVAPTIEIDEAPIERWRIDTGEEPTAPVRAGATLCYGTEAGEIVARNAVNGEERWRAETDSRDAPVPAFHGDRVIAAGETVLAVDVEDGEEVWTAETSGRAVGHPVIAHDDVHFTNSGRVMHALSALTGERSWGHVTRGSIRAPMSIVNGAAFVVDEAGYLYRLDDGSRTWRVSFDDELTVTPVAAGGSLYVVTGDGDLHAAVQASGNERWEAGVSGSIDFKPVVTSDRCLVTESWGRITAFDPDDGSSVWQMTVDERVRTPPIVVGETCLVGTDEGNVIGIDVGSGSVKWTVSVLEESIVGICGGLDRLHVTGADGGIAGAYVPGALEARRAIVDLERIIDRSDERGLSAADSRARLDDAREALDRREYDDAVAEAETGIDAAEETIAEVESLLDRVAEIRAEATRLEGTAPVETDDVLELVDRAETAAEEGDVGTARERIRRAEETLDERAGGYREAADALEALEATITSAREANVSVGEATERRSTAESSLEDGDVDRAREIARDATDRLEERITTAKRARERIDELASAIDDAEAAGIRITDGRDALAAAESALADDEYGSAVDHATEGIETVAETVQTAEDAADRIEEAETFSPTQPGAEAIAERLGSDVAIEEARVAYEADEYDRALVRATEARTIQRRARWTIDGTVGGGVVGGALLYRYGSLDRPAEFIAERTTFGRDAEDDDE